MGSFFLGHSFQAHGLCMQFKHTKRINSLFLGLKLEVEMLALHPSIIVPTSFVADFFL